MARKNVYAKHWPAKNLADLINFLERTHPEGLVLKDIAQETGISHQHLCQMLMRDDMRLSRVEEIAETLGYTLRLFFPQKVFPYGRPAHLSQRNREFPNAGNLAGLVRYINDSGMTVFHMSQRIGRANNVIKNAFETGNIAVSTLLDITDNLGITIEWSFEPKTEQTSQI